MSEIQGELGFADRDTFMQFHDWSLLAIRRLLEPIGNMPAEGEERYYAMQEEPAMAA